VGYLLDQIRANGEKKELKDEVIALAKRYGITTPYTSYLIVPDSAVPVVNFVPPPPGGQPRPRPVPLRGGGRVPEALKPAAPGGPSTSVTDFARKLQEKPGELGGARGTFADTHLKKKGDGKGADDEATKEAREKKAAYDRALYYLRRRDQAEVQAGKLGVDLSVQTATLRTQTRLEQTALRQVQGRQLMEIGGVWIDQGFTPKTPALVVKAQSDAYFKLLEKKPELKDVFRLGNHLIWLTPSGTALVIDLGKGQEKLSEKEIDKLFVKK
jgi:Ca-activated chloride channel family protein